jgi:RNA polymerase sigma factor (sigma-70 family)
VRERREYNTDALEENALVRSAQDGDSNALAKLVIRYAPRVSALVYQHLGEPEATRDVSQATFLKACRKIGALKATETFRAWLFRIAINESVEFIRRNRAQKRDALRITDVSVEDVPERRKRPLERLIAEEERAAVVAALDELPSRQRSVFVMRHFHGLTNPEIAEVLLCSTSAVKANLSYALKSLREKLAGGDDSE